MQALLRMESNQTASTSKSAARRSGYRVRSSRSAVLGVERSPEAPLSSQQQQPSQQHHSVRWLPASRLASSRKALEALKEQSSDRYASSNKPVLIGIGLTVHTAPVDLREKLAVPEAEWPRSIAELCEYPHIAEAAVLSTCNRMELYVVARSWHAGVREVEDWLCKSSGVPLEELRSHLFLLKDRDATHHLMRVAGGLDSLVQGEGQILAQVKQVHKAGQSVPGFGRHLNGLFKQAITAGKRVRSETSISTGSVSVSSAAVELAATKLRLGGPAAGTAAAASMPATHAHLDLANPSYTPSATSPCPFLRLAALASPSTSASSSAPTSASSGAAAALAAPSICVVGAGKMAALLVKHLASKGARSIALVNRSLPRAEALAEQFPDITFSLHLMPDLLACVEASDLVFTASGSDELLVTSSAVARMGPAPGGGPRRFLDISVPRNVDPAIGGLAAGVAELYNVDDLRAVVEGNMGSRAAAAAEAEVLLVEEMRAFEAWRDSLDSVPTIKALRSLAETVRTQELQRAIAKLGGTGSAQAGTAAAPGGAPAAGLSKKQLAVMEELSRGIVAKLLHRPLSALRAADAPEAVDQVLANTQAAQRLFDLLMEEPVVEPAAAKP